MSTRQVNQDELQEKKEWEAHQLERKINRKAFFIVTGLVMIGFFFVIGTLAGLALFISGGLKPVEASDEPVRLTIERGTRTSQIATMLEENGLIHNEQLFNYYLRLKNEGSGFQAGTYDIYPGMSIDVIIDKFNRGDTVPIQYVRFTIPEGFTVDEIAERLTSLGLVDYDTFLQATTDFSGLTSPLRERIPDIPEMHHRLEGYLFPDTYQIKEDSTELEIINLMMAELERKLATLPDDWELQLEDLGISFHEMMTIASIIEREVVVDEERALVASVIYNRLAEEMMLQIDATVQFLMDEQLEVVSYADLEIESPYNTYRNMGLPPGPIASPGIAAIEAALFPAESVYKFYVTKKDGSRGHYFAETFAEHQRNIELSNREASE